MAFTAIPTTTDPVTGRVIPTVSAKDPNSAASQKDLFLGMLVAQLKNQDPTSPMDQKDMMAQMAQMSSVEQLTNMASQLQTISTNAAFGQSVQLIGKSVDYLGGAYGTTLVTGHSVTSVTIHGANVNLVLDDGTKIAPGDVVRVG